jgi:hypothetical protein
MPLNVQSATLPEGPALRALVLASLEPVLGSATVLDESLPLEGAPALVLDGEGRATLVSFDPEDGGRALLSGLSALEAVASAGGWLAGHYPALAAPEALEGLQLLALGPTAPAGLGRTGTPPRLRVGTFRAVQVGEETGLLVDLVAHRPRRPEGPAPGPGRQQPFRTGLVTLSAEEEAFFDRV